MTNIPKQIKELPKIEYPDELHFKIMESIRLQKLKLRLNLILAFMTFNFLATAWFILSKLKSSNMMSDVSAMLDGFEMSYDFFSDFSKIILQFIPAEYLIIFSTNVITVLFLLNVFKKLKNFFNKSV